MTFAHPWALLGAAAALIPLLIHLFDRRRPRPHPFGAISFVLKSQKRTASRLKLRRLILYALRTLILLALPVALARPEWVKPASAAAMARGPAATCIVLDTSLSMRWSGGTPLFERAREEARDALKDLLPEESASVLLCGPSALPPGAPTFDRRKLRALIDEAKPGFGVADLSRCLELAARSLEESPLPGKRLVVVSDLTVNALRLEAPAPTVAGPKGERVRPEFVLRDAASAHAALPNRGIVDLKVEPALQVGPRAFQFTFTVKNFSSEAVKDLEATLKVGGQVVAKGFLDLGPNGTAQKVLTHRFEQGGVATGEVALAPDALADDDRRAFVLTVPRELKALVVNGAPNTVRYRDEAFFVDAALTAPGSPVREALRDTEAGFREDFGQYDLVLLLNVPAPAPDVAARLADFVTKGGGLFISMGDNVDPELYNQRLAEVLPRPLRLAKTAVNPGDEGAEARAAKLGDLATEHPVFSPFTGKAREGLSSARFYRYMLLEAEPVAAGAKPKAEVLAAYEDGAPAVAVARQGAGRVMLFTSSVDRDWSDFAIRTSFLPLMQRFCAYLTGSLDEREELRARIGDTLLLRPEATGKPSGVRAPSGAEVPLKPQPDGTVLVGPVVEPGVHAVVDTAGQPLPALSFAAVLDPSESDLTRLRPDELAAYFGEESVKSAGGGDVAQRVPFWTWLIVAAAAAFFFEGVLLRK
jgi:hypothetical protein